MAKKKGRLQPRKAPATDDNFRAAEEYEAPSKIPASKKYKDDDPGDYFQGATGESDSDDGEPIAGPVRKKTKDGKVKPSGRKVIVPKRRVVSMDPDRKLTKAARAKLQIWKGNQRGRAIDAFFRKQVEQARKKLGHSAVYLGSEADALVVCIPMYAGHGPDAAKYPGCLPMEFVFCQDGFPLGLVIQLVAKTGVGKSGLLAEFLRWFYIAGGGGNVCEAETKFNWAWYASIMGKDYADMVPLYRCKSVEDWQRKLTFAIETTQQDMVGTKDNPGPGRTLPVLFGVDSIMGKQSEETQEQIVGTRNVKVDRGTTGTGGGKKKRPSKIGLGHATRGYPIEAQIITRYMRTIPQMLDGWPFGLVLVNHLRIKTDDQGFTERSKAGGEQVNFQESFELELKKIGGHKKMIQTANFEGFTFELSCEKNSFGPTHRRIQTRFLWWYEETGPDEWEQRTLIDWDWSTVHLLDNLLNADKSSPQLKHNLQEIGFHLKIVSRGDQDNLAWSETLDMTEDDACSWSELGALIREDANLMRRLRKALRINARSVLQGDYLDQLDSLSEEKP